MLKLKKNYNVNELKGLQDKGYNIEIASELNTYGISGSGYMERLGIKINGANYQVIYSSRGYGRITSDITYYDGRYFSKHITYIEAVKKHFNNNVLPYVKN